MAIKYPIRNWLGKFQKFILVTSGRMEFRRAASRLECFFDHFPTAKGLELFTVADIREYADWRLSQGTTKMHLRKELQTLSRFYRWCIDKGCRLWDPAYPWLEGLKPVPKLPGKVMTVGELQRILDVSSRPLRQYILAIVGGYQLPRELPPRLASSLLKLATARAGVPHITLKVIRYSLRRGLWADIIRRHCLAWGKEYLHTEVHDAPVHEAETLSAPLTDIEVSSLNEGSPVINSSDDCFSVGWVSEFEDCPEPESLACHSQEPAVVDFAVSS